MYKGRKETTHERVGERKTYNNIKKEISTMYVYKWSQDLMYKNNVSKQERKEKIQSILTTTLNKNNTPLKNDYSHIQNYSPFLSRMTKGKSIK